MRVSSLVLLTAVLAITVAPRGYSAEITAVEKSATVETKPVAGGHGEKKGGLDFMALERYDLGIYTLIVFGIVCAILFKYAWPKISDGLARREAGLLAMKDDIAKSKAEAEQVTAKLHAEFAAAQDKIRAMMDEARREADALRVKERETGAKEAAAERERAKREIESAKDAALVDIYQQSVELATKLSAKTLTRHISADDHRMLLDESLAELKQAIKA